MNDAHSTMQGQLDGHLGSRDRVRGAPQHRASQLEVLRHVPREVHLGRWREGCWGPEWSEKSEVVFFFLTGWGGGCGGCGWWIVVGFISGDFSDGVCLTDYPLPTSDDSKLGSPGMKTKSS